MKISNSTYIIFIEIAMEIVSVIKPYSGKYSKKIYTQQQLFILLILKQKLKISYDLLIEDMKTRTEILLMLGLHKLPNPSTVRKFAKRINCKLIENFIGSCINLTRKKKLNLGIDATSLHIEDGSFYYRQVLGKPSRSRRSVKLSISADTDKQLVIATKIRKTRSHDNKDFLLLTKNSAKVKPIKVIAADKAYDDTKNHLFIKEIKAKNAIAIKDKLSSHNRNIIRKELAKNFDEKLYHQRSKVETVFSVVKRLFGAVLYAKRWIMQKKELLFKLLAYNINRLVYLRRIS